MKTRDMVQKIAREAERQGVAWVLASEGANHTIYSLDGRLVAILRHRETDERLARTVFEECEPTLGKGWWQ